MIVLHINEKSNIDILPLWINFYKNNNISFIIHTNLQLDIDKKLCSSNDDYLNKEKHIVLTEYDYLFSYKKGENDVMLLSNDISGLEHERSIIGKVFYVPVKDKKEYTTFEIPDFIIYKHDNHTNYTKDGIIINNGNIPSNNFVCFSLKISKYAMETEYYENDILFDISNPDNVYIEYEYNIFVNKEKKYGIIWHYKCACSSIKTYFCKINNLNKIVDNDLLVNNNIYKYNNYLQEVDIISFVRNPFFRFISCYFNKHIIKGDKEYLEHENYLNYLNIYKNDTLFNFADYLQNNNIIDEHSLCISKMNYFNKYKNLNYKIVHIEDINLNEYLFHFFSKYHILEKLTIFYNVTHTDDLFININKEYKFYNYNDWINYLKIEKVIPNYICILDDEFIKKLNIIYNDDLVLLNYKNKLLKNTNINNNINENLPDDFDVSIYKKINIDLQNYSDIDAITHYIQYGKYENRQYKINIDIRQIINTFDSFIYKELNPDLQSLTDNESIIHYIQSGFNEGRLYKIDNLPYDFNVCMYKEINPDLQSLSDIQAKAHYIQYGKNEGKLYKIDNLPDDFNVYMYKEINPNLQPLSDNQAKAHYLQYGKNENKLYKIDNLPDDFNVCMYKEINPDLQPLSDIQAKAHYIQYGKHEKRIYKYNIIIQTTAKDEDIIICEWIVHNILLGIDHIYIYDDYSIIPITTTIQILPEWILQKVTVYRLEFDYYNEEEIKNTEYWDFYNKEEKWSRSIKQRFLINYFINKHKNISNWGLFIDVDEFIYLKTDTNMNEFIKKYNNESGLYLQWLMYGTSFHIDINKQTLIMDNNLYHSNKYHPNGKSIVKMNNINKINNSHTLINDLYYFDTNIKIFDLPIHLAHYHKISVKTYLKRRLRKEIGHINGNIRDSNNIISLLTYDNDTYDEINPMNKYIIEINKILNKEFYFPLDYSCINKSNNIIQKYFNEKNNLCSIIIYNNGITISPIKQICNINYELLQEIIYSNNLTYGKYHLLLPNDFNSELYKELNPDLQTYTNTEIKNHYLQYGKYENKLYNIDNLPDDFNVFMYKELNPDLQPLSDIQVKLHYIQYGKNEGKLYKIENVPDDFNVFMYKEINPDLQPLSDNQAKLHYIQYGKNEGKLYKIENVPDDFDTFIYKELNEDLKNLTELQAKLHYVQHGYKEDRLYKDIHFNKKYFCKINNYNGSNPYKKYIEDIRQEKNSYFKEQINSINIPNKNTILLVNHDNKLYGANHYIYLLFLYLKDKYKDIINIFLCEINYKSSLYDKYSIKKEYVFEYQHDPTLLYMLYQKIQPKVFYLNSCNYAIYQVYKYIPENRRILHSHEIFTHYLLSKKVMPDYVVSEVISNQYNQLYKKQPKIQPPFITNIDNILELSKENIEPIYNNYNKLDTNKITIGMCGQITERKNYKLFIEMSLHFSFYNFIWIGDSTPVFDEYKNIYHIKSTNNPYKYFKQIIDHFILFSLEDPCPYVILENILLESNIITFKNNIYYHHTHENLKDMFINYDGNINKTTCIDAIYKYVNCKKKNNKNNGYNYIKNYFSKPIIVEEKIDELLN